MKAKVWLAVGVAVVVLSFACCICPAAERDEQCQLVQTYLEAYVRREMPNIRGYAAAEPQDLFGPYPFVGLPTLSQPVPVKGP